MMAVGRQWVKRTQLLALVGVLAAAGCGYKDDPVPPQDVLPRAVTDLRVDLDEEGATLSWSYPRKTVTGGDVAEIDRFELYRAEVPVDRTCPACPVPYGAAIEVPGGTLVPDSGRTAVFEVRDLRPGNVYFFKVRSRSGWWRTSNDSNEVSFLWQTPPAVPQALAVVAGDGQNILQWQPVTALRDGSALTVPVTYQLYRGIDDGTVDVIGEPVAATRYIDHQVTNGRTYTYQVQTVAKFSRGTVSSGLSEGVQANPQDRTPPPVPSQVEALRTEVGVKVFWEAPVADDLAGFRVYRRGGGTAEPVLIGEVNLPYTLFVDGQAPAGALLYSVSSIDARQPAHESARSAEIRAE
jgi:hypothetical protein